MILFAFLWLLICARCQEEERTDSCTGQPTVNCIYNQDGSQATSPYVYQNKKLSQGKPGKAGPRGVKGQKGEAGGLNFTSTQWLKRELDEVKTKLASTEAKFYTLNEKLVDVKTNLSSSEAKFEEVKQELAGIKIKLKNQRIPYSSCSDINNGTTWDSGEYLINPDPNQVSPFYVFCNFSGNTPETVIGHNSMDEFEFTGCELPFCYKKKIVYDATLQQISALIQVSRNCRQFIKLRCIRVLINWLDNQPYAGWLSRNGTRQLYWGGATSRRPHYCACGETGSCSDLQKKCNCDKNVYGETSDEGFLTYKDHLPVTELQFGDAGDSGERGWHTLGPLICSN